ncbi:MAG TPA: L-2-hydroxyglutarate oxidase [Thermoanaerobaculia bacterium]|nr:L-2-hydroxyglutarate oxidase [Thermoanaerobaculia bacterium]
MSTGLRPFDVLCVGGGIVGLATARALARRFRCRVALLEAESRLAAHQTGHNSGVLHSGLYYRPGSRRARNCVEGRRRLVAFCGRHDIAHAVCGKLVIATTEAELPRLDELEQRGIANGLQGLVRLDAAGIVEHEPHAVGLAALRVAETGIADFVAAARAIGHEAQELGVELFLGSRVRAVRTTERGVFADIGSREVSAAFLVNCAGLQSDRVAELCGVRPSVRIVPFRGDYLELREDRRDLVRNLIYPVPDPQFPFLGVHLTRRVDGSVEAGPNAVLSLDRSGYRRRAVDLRDAWSSLSWPGFWRMAARTWRIGGRELLRGGSPRRFARELRRFVPSIEARDLVPGGCGIRAQALGRDGTLVDDFVIERGTRSLHVLNAPSPAATSALALADDVANLAAEQFGLRPRIPATAFA